MLFHSHYAGKCYFARFEDRGFQRILLFELMHFMV